MGPAKRAVLTVSVVVAFFLATGGRGLAVEVGQKAPDFELESTKGGKLKLSNLQGKNVLINFYGRDYDPT